jgi:hypothetical protein
MKFLIKNKDGTVAEMTVVAEGVTPEECLAKWHKSNRDQIESFRPLQDGDMPDGRYFRDALRHKDDKVVHDMDECLKIHQDVLRLKRKPILDRLDVEYMRAVEENDMAAARVITAKKNALRDVTKHPSVLEAKTPEELKGAIPAVLLES